MPDVSTTLARLRESAADDFIHQKPYVPLADAVSAVEEAYRAGEDARTAEIEKLLRNAAIVAVNTLHDGYVPGYRAGADLVAARFPARDNT